MGDLVIIEENHENRSVCKFLKKCPICKTTIIDNQNIPNTYYMHMQSTHYHLVINNVSMTSVQNYLPNVFFLITTPVLYPKKHRLVTGTHVLNIFQSFFVEIPLISNKKYLRTVCLKWHLFKVSQSLCHSRTSTGRSVLLHSVWHLSYHSTSIPTIPWTNQHTLTKGI